MSIHLSGGTEQMVHALMREGKFGSEEEVVTEALRLLEQREKGASSGDADEQRKHLLALCRTFDAMPVAPVTDGLTNRDHDRIVYGQ